MGANCDGSWLNPSTPLCSAASGGHLDIVELLLEADNLTILPLAMAAEAGHQAIVGKTVRSHAFEKYDRCW
jgi:ankyrin repeat protein